MNTPEFRLNEFRDLAKWVGKKFPAPVAFFLNGWLWGLESLYIAAKARAAVEEGITPHKPPMPVIGAPRRLITPSEIEGLDILEYHYEFTGTRDEDEGGLQGLPDTGVEGARPPETN